MLISIGVNYVAGLLMEKYDEKPKVRKICFWVAFVVTLGFLLFFKYTNFFLSNINALFGIGLPLLDSSEFHLPLGISFYTFQILSYTIDLYRGDVEVQRNPVSFALYVALFPQLIAGPIIKYKDLGDQIDHRTCTTDKFASGVQHG